MPDQRVEFSDASPDEIGLLITILQRRAAGWMREHNYKDGRLQLNLEETVFNAWHPPPGARLMMARTLQRHEPETAARIRKKFEAYLARWDAQQARLQARWKAAKRSRTRTRPKA